MEKVRRQVVDRLTGLGVDDFKMRIGPVSTSLFLTDALGSLVATTDAAGGVQSEVTYEPFGGTEISSPAPAYRFTGREHDEPLYLYYYRARYYHTDLQRFISEDPIEFAGDDINLYAYVTNDPLRWTDPLGLKVLNPQNLPVQPKVLAALDKFNQHIGLCKDIVITGGDRPSDPESHGKGLAADIKVPGQPHLLTANQAAESGLFGGVGWYEEGYCNPNDAKVGPHVHVDIRSGTFRWGFDKSGKEYHRSFRQYTGTRQGCPQSGRK